MTIPQSGNCMGLIDPVALINVAVSPLSVCSNYSAARNSFHGVATSVSVIECPWLRMIIVALSIFLGIVSLDDVYYVETPQCREALLPGNAFTFLLDS